MYFKCIFLYPDKSGISKKQMKTLLSASRQEIFKELGSKLTVQGQNHLQNRI